MGEPGLQLERVQVPGRSHRLPASAAVIVIVAILTFAVGLGVGSRTVLGPAQSPLPAFQAGQISHELWLAYLGVAKRLDGWTLCRLGAPITCQAAYSPPFMLFSDFSELPLTVTNEDWQTLAAPSLPAGHYILAGPNGTLADQVSFARVTTGGIGTLIGPDSRIVWSGVDWEDLGTLAPGRYIAVIGEFELNQDPAGSLLATHIGWAIGMDVTAP